jgi:hypothetical protein
MWCFLEQHPNPLPKRNRRLRPPFNSGSVRHYRDLVVGHVSNVCLHGCAIRGPSVNAEGLRRIVLPVASGRLAGLLWLADDRDGVASLVQPVEKAGRDARAMPMQSGQTSASSTAMT